VAPLLASGRLDPPIGGTYPLAGAAAALAEINERRAAGKLVLTTRTP
jgi:NADPH2:quinone reductase